MNAPLTLPHGLSNAALNGEDLLRALAGRAMGEPFASQTEIAKATNRAPKNIGRDLSQLEAAKLIQAPGVDYGEWSAAAITDAGWDALSALERAAGAGAELFVMPSQLDDNPLNPRKTYDADKLEGLADTVEADGRIIEPLSVSPVQPNGRRFIWAGHRRKRAALIVEARFASRGETLPPGLVQGLPCVERDATPAESLFIAVVENSQRENLTPWEDAQALLALADATGWSARELARRTGRAPKLDQGDEEGVRDVQEKIKVARTAPADLVQAHESGALTWELFRAALRTGRLPDTPATATADFFPPAAGELQTDAPTEAPANEHLALMLVEAALAADLQDGVWDATLILPKALAWPTGWLHWFDYAPDTGATTLNARATDWLAAAGLGDDPELLLAQCRAATGATQTAACAPWSSEVLNAIGQDKLPEPEPEPEGEAWPALDAHQQLTLLEIMHASLSAPDRMVAGDDEDQVAYAPTGKYWLDLVASTLQTLRLIDFKHHGRPYVRLTPTGLRWLAQHFADPITLADLERVRVAVVNAGIDPGDRDPAAAPPYWTDWLNPPPPAEDTPATAAPQQTTAEAETADIEDAVAAQLLSDALTLADGADHGMVTVRNLLARTGVEGPFAISQSDPGIIFDAAGEATCVVDVDNQLADDTARARAAIIAAALNRACGYHPLETQ